MTFFLLRGPWNIAAIGTGDAAYSVAAAHALDIDMPKPGTVRPDPIRAPLPGSGLGPAEDTTASLMRQGRRFGADARVDANGGARHRDIIERAVEETLARTGREDFFARFHDTGEVTVVTDRSVNGTNDLNYAVKFTRLDAGIYYILIRNPDRHRWEALNYAKMQDPHCEEGRALSKLLDRAFASEGGVLWLGRPAVAAQRESLLRMARKGAVYIRELKGTQQIMQQVNFCLQSDYFPGVLRELTRASVADECLAGGNVEMDFIAAMRTLPERLFGRFCSETLTQDWPGYSRLHMQRILRRYAAAYAWNVIDLDLLAQGTATVSYQDRMRLLAQSVRIHPVLLYTDTAALERVREIALAHAQEDNLSQAVEAEIDALLPLEYDGHAPDGAAEA